MYGTARFWLRVAAAVLAAVAGIGLGLDEAGTWNAPRGAAVALVAMGVLVALIVSVESAIDRYLYGRAEEMREQARAVLAPLLIELEDATGVDTGRLGVSAYRVRPRIVSFGPARLERIVRMQLVIRVASGISWRVGVGVIGQCVTRGEDVIENLATLDEELTDVAPDVWETLPDDLTYGLTHDEYLRVRGKYDVVLATPMIQERPMGSRVIGCIAVDAPATAYDALAKYETRGLVAAAAVPLAALVSQRRLRWR